MRPARSAPAVRHEGACSPCAGQGVGRRDVVGERGPPWGARRGGGGGARLGTRGGRRHAGRELARRARSLADGTQTVATSTLPRRSANGQPAPVAANLVATWLIFS